MLVAKEPIPLTLEHACTKEERALGLSGRAFLPQNHGMLFHYDQPEIITIWMYRTLIDLSLAFLDETGTIRQINELKSYPEISDPAFFAARGVRSNFPATYALEMKAGFFAEHAIGPGARLTWEAHSSKALLFSQ